ncbi:MAG: polyphosphate polymerase domain-containing protein [Kangiellaceae bacterium]
MDVLKELPPMIERHELKYAIPYTYVEPITNFIAPYCSLDHYSAVEDDHYYHVSSLYFDTDNLEFLQQRLYGKDGRFNVRARCYGKEGVAPYFLEIKRKQGVTGVKFRATASQDEWPHIICDPSFRVSENESLKERVAKERFIRVATSYDIKPQILTQYKRRAFFSTVDDYARVTMDISMKYRSQSDFNMQTNDAMVSYDNETIYANNCLSDATVILELKCNVGQVPTWMLDLISFFELKQQGFSKYVASSLVSRVDNGIEYMSGDRVASGF